jgi:hypothetical protein
MEDFLGLLKFVHILGFVFMSAPLYSLIMVNERGKFSSSFNYSVDRYLENILKGQSIRCYVFQLTVLLSGILLLIYSGDIQIIFTNYIFALKLILLLSLAGLLSYVHFGIQPKIESLISQLNPENLSQEIISKIKSLRIRRKKLATFCLFIFITIIILSSQIYVEFNIFILLALLSAAALFSLRVYKTTIPYGWL